MAEVGTPVPEDGEERSVDDGGPEDPVRELFVSEGSEVGADTTEVGSCGTELEGEDRSGAVAIGSTASNEVSRHVKKAHLYTHCEDA